MRISKVPSDPTNLSIIDLAYTTTIVPRLIRDLIAKENSMSFNNCMTQIFTAHFLAAVEVFILVSISFDHYVAICKPLHYTIIMNQQRFKSLILVAWVVAFWHSIPQTLMVVSLPFCGSNQVDHYICDVKALLNLVCSDIHIPNILVIANSGLVVLGTFLDFIASYIVIFYKLRKHSSEARRKALSTCASHILVVVLFFVPCIATYIPPPSASQKDKEFSMFYTVVAPMPNPLIYTLRNTEMKNAIRKVWEAKNIFFNSNKTILF